MESAGGPQLLATEIPELLSNGHIGRLHRAAGQVIFAEGDDGTCLYVIEKGRVRVGRHDRTERECLFTVLGLVTCSVRSRCSTRGHAPRARPR